MNTVSGVAPQPTPAPTVAIEVAVLSDNANGAPEFTFHAIRCSAAAYENGEHYDLAKDEAAAQGYEPRAAFDANDPAWSLVKEQRAYKKFFRDAFEGLQQAFVGDQACSGADTVDAVAQVFAQQLEALPVALYMAASRDGFWNNNEGWVADAQLAFISPDSARFLGLTGADVTVVAMPAGEFDQITEFPTIEEIEDAVVDARARGQKYGFAITAANASEVVGEELAAIGATLPRCLNELAAKLALTEHEHEHDGEQHGA